MTDAHLKLIQWIGNMLGATALILLAGAAIGFVVNFGPAHRAAGFVLLFLGVAQIVLWLGIIYGAEEARKRSLES